VNTTSYNLNEGKNAELLQKTQALHDYCIFVHCVSKNLHDGMDLDAAIAKAVDYCINADVMAQYLQEKRKEVVSMLGFEI